MRRSLALVAVLAVAALPACSRDAEAGARFDRRTAVGAPASTTTTRPPPLPERFGAEAIVPSVAVFEAPGATTPVRTMANPTWEHVPLAFMVVERQPDWLKVQLNVRPNGSTGWIHASDVLVHDVPFRIVVDRAAHLLTLYQGYDVVQSAAVAVGTGGAPTPTGSFYIDAIVKITNPRTVWGPFQLSVSAFSDVYHRFGGGSGQIAIHGTNAPGLIGRDVSHGCVRMQNPDITALASRVSLGTPVDIIN
jgi:lipoprotein-anchoring transpeptidase ErfK/SrfK